MRVISIVLLMVTVLEGFEFSEGFRGLLDAVVRIDVWTETYEKGRKREVQYQGSGVIMTEEGHILTNGHVADLYTQRIRVTLSNLERVDAAFVGWDHWTDLAVLKLDMDQVRERGYVFRYARFAESPPELGDSVYAVGTPHGLARTVTKGIVSNVNRFIAPRIQDSGYEVGHFSTWYQTDAAVNQGNSGGPLVNEAGEVVGINTLIAVGANNLGFSIPAELCEGVMAAIIKNGEVVRSDIGVSFKPLQDLENYFDVAVNHGVLIQDIDPGSPAKLGGLRPGDIILEIEGEEVDGRFPEQIPPVMNKIASFPVGSEIALKVLRDKEEIDTTLRTESLKSRAGAKYAFEEWGLSVEKLTRGVAREMKLESDSGFRVIGVQKAFPGDIAGLRKGDVIKKVNRVGVNDLASFIDIYNRYREEPQKILLEVNRYHNLQYLVLKPME